MIKKAVLVYQNSIANVFQVDCFNMSNFGREAKRLFQGSYSDAESFASGLVACGVMVCSMVCNEYGDITNKKWSDDLEDGRFFKQMNPVFQMNEYKAKELIL